MKNPILTFLFCFVLAFAQAGQNVQYDTINGIAIAGGANTITLSKGTTTLTLNTTLTPVPNTLTINGHALTANVTITKGDIDLGNVENTALSTWAGSANLTTGAGGLFGTAAYTASTAYATSAQGTKADAAIQSIATPGVIFTNPVSVTSGAATLALINQSANTVFGNFTGSAASPTFSAAPTFAATNLTGTAANLTAGGVTTNANLTGPITSVGNATSIASQTGTGTTFAMRDSPTFTGTVLASAITFTTALKSTTALATPSALAATQFTGFASTVSGAAIMGFGTTNDVSLMNRAGIVCLGVGPNTTAINIPGPLNVVGASNFGGVIISAAGIYSSGSVTGSLYFADNSNTVAYVKTATDSTHAWTLTNRTATKVLLTITGAASQSADLFNVTNSTSTLLFSVGNTGQLSLRDGTGTDGGNASLYWASGPYGLYNGGVGTGLIFGTNGQKNLQFSYNVLGMNKDVLMGWSSTTDVSAAKDVYFTRSAAATVALTGSLTISGTLAVTGATTHTGATIFTPAARSGSGAISITASSTAFTSTAAGNALTLANGTDGQIITIAHVSQAALGTGVLTPTTANGFATVTFTNAGDSVTLQYFATGGWVIIGSRGVTIS